MTTTAAVGNYDIYGNTQTYPNYVISASNSSNPPEWYWNPHLPIDSAGNQKWQLDPNTNPYPYKEYIVPYDPPPYTTATEYPLVTDWDKQIKDMLKQMKIKPTQQQIALPQEEKKSKTTEPLIDHGRSFDMENDLELI